MSFYIPDGKKFRLPRRIKKKIQKESKDPKYKLFQYENRRVLVIRMSDSKGFVLTLSEIYDFSDMCGIDYINLTANEIVNAAEQLSIKNPDRWSDDYSRDNLELGLGNAY